MLIPEKSYLISYIMEGKYFSKLVNKEELGIINNSDSTEIKDLYKVEISDRGSFRLKQLHLNSIEQLL